VDCRIILKIEKMKKYINTVSLTKISVWIYVMLLSTSALFAQGITPVPDAPVDADPIAAPIGDYIWVLALIGLVFAFMKVRAIVLQANTSK
jgi:hypothetical protein